jgi:alkanesulfonate monooxygenase SsuD/methylene tetrahydromethanopterin reductase-like flavin-dependent oxidoreductase (luciferase family)
MADEKAIGNHIAPRINAAAEAAGRPAPRVVAGIPVCLCGASEIDAARERANLLLTESEFSPNYQRLLEHGNAQDAGDLILAGDEDAILAGFQRYIDAGVTDISMRLLPVGDTREELRASRDRTREAVAYMAKDLR